MNLKDDIRQRIVATGPISVASYMALALGDPDAGYYPTRDPLGAAGDFTTAPEISQMFGEMVGLWCVHMWSALGSPTPFNLVELGPGRGTLMADMLRAARVAPAFLDAARMHLVETSPALREKQRQSLAKVPVPVTWHADLTHVPGGPMLLVANEFFDALPVRQYVHTMAGWHERCVGVDAHGALAWTLGPPVAAAMIPGELRACAPGTIVEISPERAAIAMAIGARLARDLGAALIIDYGYAGPAAGDTLQALKGHGYVDPLTEPGEADLTTHVDFTALAQAVDAAGARAYGLLSQAEFLVSLGIDVRARRLQAAHADKAGEIDLALARLVAPEQMGALFKVLALTSPRLAAPSPFRDH